MEGAESCIVGKGSGLKPHILELNEHTKLDIPSSKSTITKVKACLVYGEKKREEGNWIQIPLAA